MQFPNSMRSTWAPFHWHTKKYLTADAIRLEAAIRPEEGILPNSSEYPGKDSEDERNGGKHTATFRLTLEQQANLRPLFALHHLPSSQKSWAGRPQNFFHAVVPCSLAARPNSHATYPLSPGALAPRLHYAHPPPCRKSQNPPHHRRAPTLQISLRQSLNHEKRPRGDHQHDSVSPESQANPQECPRNQPSRDHVFAQLRSSKPNGPPAPL